MIDVRQLKNRLAKEGRVKALQGYAVIDNKSDLVEWCNRCGIAEKVNLRLGLKKLKKQVQEIINTIGE